MKMLLRALLYGFFCFLVSDLFAEEGRPTAEQEIADPMPELQGLKKEWQKLIKELNVPGIAVVVVKNDKVVMLESLGWCDPEKKLPVTPDTLFYIASSTKSFTALGIVKLAEEGKLNLDDSVKKYLPRFQLAKDTESISLRDLLAHRRNIENSKIVSGEAFTGHMPDALYYELLEEIEPTKEEKFDYGNTHFTLLGRIIESVTGKSWKRYLHEEIFPMLGFARSTCSANTMWADKDVALPQVEINGRLLKAKRQKTDRTMHAAGGMGTSSSDLAKWLEFNINEGNLGGNQVLGEKWIKEMHKSQIACKRSFYEFERIGYGLGWYIGKYKGKTMIHHFGGFTGFRPHISFIPEEKIGVAVLMNMSSPNFYFPDYIAVEIYDRLLGLKKDKDRLQRLTAETHKFREKLKRNQRSIEQMSEPNPTKVVNGLSLDATAYCNKYFNRRYGFFEIGLEKGKLWGQLGDDKPFHLKSLGTDQFSILSFRERRGTFLVKGGKVLGIKFLKGSREILFEPKH